MPADSQGDSKGPVYGEFTTRAKAVRQYWQNVERVPFHYFTRVQWLLLFLDD